MAKKKAKPAKATTKVTTSEKKDVKVSADNPYKKGSRKAAIYEVFKTDGLDAAVAYAEHPDVGIKRGTVKSWSGGWTKGETRKAKAAPGDKPAKSDVVHEKGFHPEFKYTSRERADQRHEALCTSSGLRPHAFHVLEDDGRFAVVPANYKPPGPPPVFNAGDIVYDAFIANTKAKVLQSGPEQTVIRYSKDRPNRPREDCVINRFLVKLPDREAKADDKTSNKIKRARL